MNDKYVGRKAALDRLGISPVTLIKLADEHKIEILRTDGGQRKFNVDKYIRDNKVSINEEIVDQVNADKINICYVRVSTLGQKDDLKRQKDYMKSKYPKYNVIEDIGSGINFNRKGLRRIIKLAIGGQIGELVIAHKDRLTRFGFELIEDLIKDYSKGRITIIEEEGIKKEPKEELVDDVLQILNVYTAKMNGLRKYNKDK